MITGTPAPTQTDADTDVRAHTHTHDTHKRTHTLILRTASNITVNVVVPYTGGGTGNPQNNNTASDAGSKPSQPIVLSLIHI